MKSRRTQIAVVAALLAAVLIVFAPVVRHQFVFWDDDIHVHANPNLTTSPGRFWTTPYQKLYIPVTYTTWAAIAALVSDNRNLIAHPCPFHLANLALHSLNTLLVASLLLALLRARSEGSRSDPTLIVAAGLGACLFAIHPVQVEPVAWVSGLKDVLCAAASLIALRAYVAAAGPAPGTRKVGIYVLATAAYGAALLSKPGAVVLPLIAATLDLAVLRRPAKSVALFAAPWLLLAIPTALVANSLQPASGIGEVVPLASRVLVAGHTLAFYMGKLVVPVDLAADYGRTPRVVLANPWNWFAWVIPASAIAALAWRPRKGPWLAAAAIFVAGILPVLGLAAFQHQKISTVADRYLYLPLLGPGLALAWALSQLQGRRLAIGSWATVAVLVALGARSAFQVPVWHDTITLFEHTLKVNPASAPAHNNLGYYLWTTGHHDEAIVHYEAAVRLAPDYGLAHNNLGNAHLFAGRNEEALKQYELALPSSSVNDVVDARNNIGLALERLDRIDQAIASYGEAIREAPYQANAHFNLGVLLHKQSRTEEAVAELRVAVGLMPESEEAREHLSMALNDLGFQAGARDDAIRLLQEAISLWPLNLQAHVNLGTLRLKAGDLDGAIRDWQEGVRLLPRSPELHHDLAIAWLRKGRMDDARQELRNALQLTPGFEPSQRLLGELQAQ